MAKAMPAIFFGHGNPMNAIQTNEWTQAWRTIGATLPRPRAILSVSAHWYLPATLVTANTVQRTIHDFGGFPRELYRVQYHTHGAPEVAHRVQELLTPLAVGLDHSWGLDHGTWSVLCHVYPARDIPTLQLSIDETQPAVFHFEVGKLLSALRDEDVLIMGSGNLVHNLHTYAWGQQSPEPFDWAVSFETTAKGLMFNGDFEPLIDYENLGRDALLSIPTPEHYLPLLYVLGTRRPGEPITFPVSGVDGGSISMLAVQVG